MNKAILAAVCVLAMVAGGCGPSTGPGAGVPTAEDWMADWWELAKKPVGELDANSATIIAGKLFEIDQNHDRLLAVLADPNATPEAKVLVMMSLRPYLNASFEPRLIELTRPEHSLSTRVDATQLLAAVGTDLAIDTVHGLLEDPEYNVRGAALVALLDAGKTDVLEHAERIWHDEKTQPLHKKRLIMTLPENYALTHLDDYADALADTEIDAEGRVAALNILVRTGDRRWLGLLSQLAESDPDETVRDIAAQAIEFLKSRVSEVEQAQTAQDGTPTPPDSPGPASVETVPATAEPQNLPSAEGGEDAPADAAATGNP